MPLPELVYRDVKGANLTPEEGDANMRALANAVTATEGVTTAHPYYHFHGYAGLQLAGDGKFLDLSGANHGLRGVHLSESQMFAAGGYISTINPATGAPDSTIHIPNLNFDYAGGEKLIIWWLGKATPEGADVPFLGDGFSSLAGQRGWRLRVRTDGKFEGALWGEGQSSGLASDGVVFDGTLHSLAIVWDGENRAYGMWSDEVYQWASSPLSEFGLNLVGFNPSVAQDTRNSNTVNIGASRPASPADGGEAHGIAVATRALVIMRFPSGYVLHDCLTLTSIFQQLRTNPGKLILESAL